jgi:hypothetical protein
LPLPLTGPHEATGSDDVLFPSEFVSCYAIAILLRRKVSVLITKN